MSKLWSWAAATLCLAACAAPTQSQAPIPVDQANLAQRLRVLCRLGVGDPTVRAACDALAARGMDQIDRPPRLQSFLVLGTVLHSSR